MRRSVRLTAIALCLSPAGCASTWDEMWSKRFRSDPFGRTFGSDEDAVATLKRLEPGDAEERARAFQRLSEPGGADQDAVVQMLSTAATTDTSPWVRVCAIDALGRFSDPRTTEILANAYHHADRVGGKSAEPAGPIQQAGGRVLAGTPGAVLGLSGPQGFPADQVANIRARSLDALGKTGRPDAVAFLARVAVGRATSETDEPMARDMARQRAVANLAAIRTKDSAVALQQVLSAESGKDIALASLAHTGLQTLTGKDLPADPSAWEGVVQAGGFEVK